MVCGAKVVTPNNPLLAAAYSSCIDSKTTTNIAMPLSKFYANFLFLFAIMRYHSMSLDVTSYIWSPRVPRPPLLFQSSLLSSLVLLPTCWKYGRLHCTNSEALVCWTASGGCRYWVASDGYDQIMIEFCLNGVLDRAYGPWFNWLARWWVLLEHTASDGCRHWVASDGRDDIVIEFCSNSLLDRAYDPWCHGFARSWALLDYARPWLSILEHTGSWQITLRTFVLG